ncbi:MAG: PKD domain-containing protein [Saprospiraceae bacterium]|nr:PKD domain-containing protein [Saprospiraceae bacterium]
MKTNLWYRCLFSLAIFMVSCEPPFEEIEIPEPSEICQPKATFQVINDECRASCTIEFENFTEGAQEYLWNFGDGNSSTDRNPSHTYEQAGSYQVELVAMCGDETALHSQTVTILEEIVTTSFSCGETYTDPRDGRTYQTMWIDEDGGNDTNKPGQCWMKSNLQYERQNMSDCYDHVIANCINHGRMYYGVSVDSVIPEGWRLPTRAEWEVVMAPYGITPSNNSTGTRYLGNILPFLEGGASGLDLPLGGGYRDLNPSGTANYQFTSIGDASYIWIRQANGDLTFLIFDEFGGSIHNQADPASMFYLRLVKESD